MPETQEDDESNSNGGPLAAFTYLNFWDEDDDDDDNEPVQSLKGFDIPVPDIDDTLVLTDVDLSEETVDVDERNPVSDDNDEGEVDKVGTFEVTDKQFQYAKVKWSDDNNDISPPLVIVNVYLSKIDDGNDD